MSTAAALEGLQERLGYRFADTGVLLEALTHPSVLPEARGDAPHGYQRLEFLGDRVLGLVIAHWLLELHGDEPEGALSRRSTGLVRREALVDVARRIGLGEHVRLSQAERQQGGRAKQAILADVAEALVGAIFRDGGLAPADAFVRGWWAPLMASSETPPLDAKTALQEWAQGRGLPLPAYRVVDRTGADHAPRFTVEVTVDGAGDAQGEAGSKRAAERLAAAALLARLEVQ
ncbi:MAG: ribonuclease III [Rhodospirillaceae bacterium]|nr:ribonuclease III [Rhodospirillaceae bacterium]